MSYEKFENNGVQYTLFLANHATSSYPMIYESGGLKDLDILVLEGYGRLENLMRYVREFPQYHEIFAKIPQENPDLIIYEPDISVSGLGHFGSLIEFGSSMVAVSYGSTVFKKGEISRREVLKRIGKAGIGILGLSFFGNLINGCYDGEDVEIVSHANAVRSTLPPTPINGFRNAVVSRIIEEYIVPKETQGRDKLNIGILFGAAHSGIEHNIKSKLLRDTTISAYEAADYFDTSRDDLNRISRLEYKDDKYVGEELLLNLF